MKKAPKINKKKTKKRVTMLWDHVRSLGAMPNSLSFLNKCFTIVVYIDSSCRESVSVSLTFEEVLRL